MTDRVNESRPEGPGGAVERGRRLEEDTGTAVEAEAGTSASSAAIPKTEGDGTAGRRSTDTISSVASAWSGIQHHHPRPSAGPGPVSSGRNPDVLPAGRRHHHHHGGGHHHRASSSRSSSFSKKREAAKQPGATPGFPWDMESLKEAILRAEAGEGRIKELITKSNFVPRAPAFTALINLCGKEKMAEKAQEVFETSADLNIAKNTYMYSALISALGGSGKWEEAFDCFENMLAEESQQCKPNTITYSALISACERAGQMERAWDVFHKMKAAGIEPDLITYSVLLSACEKDAMWGRAAEVIEMMHAGGMHASVVDYTRVINALGEKGEVARAVDMFQKLQLSGCQITLNLCNIMLNCLERNGRGDLAYHLMRSMHDNGIIGETVTYNMVLCSLSKSADPGVMPVMLEVYNTMKYLGVRVTSHTFAVLIKACGKFGDPRTAIYLTHEVQQLSVQLDPSTWEALNQLLGSAGSG